jgi:hypothetical protein
MKLYSYSSIPRVEVWPGEKIRSETLLKADSVL